MLTLSFFVIALLYATVGFGGGSSYLAILSVGNVPFELIPKISLICNLLVVSSGSYHYFKRGHFNKKLILPFVLSSVPMAFLGGMYPISEKAFIATLAMTLVLAGLRLLFVTKFNDQDISPPSQISSVLVGGILGFLSGLVGLGGGVFLAPLMLNLKWARPKEVAATSSVFIFLNSFSGLVGQMTKGNVTGDILSFWPLFLAVILGGQIGSRLGSHPKIPQILVQRATAVLILFIAGRLLLKIFF